MKYQLTLYISITAGFILRLAGLRGMLWYDEAFSAWLAALPMNRLLEATLNDVHPPFYYILLWGVNRAWGNSEIALRLPSVAAGMALIVVAHRLAGQLKMSRQAQILAVGLTALAPFQIYYSTEARSYAFQMLACALAALGLIERRWWLLVAGSLAALYLQHTSGLFVLALFAAGAASGVNRKTLAFCAAAIGLGFLPGLLILAQQSLRVGAGYWILPVDHPGRIFDVLDSLIFYTPGNPFFLSGLVTALAITLLLADAKLLWVEQRLAVMMVGLPVLLAVAVSLVWQSVFIARIFAPATPFFYILIAQSVTRSHKRLFLWGGAAAAFLIAINGAVLLGRAGRSTEYQLLPDYQPGDGIYHTNTGSIVIWRYYLPGEQVLWQQENSLGQNLTTATKRAMGMAEGDFEQIACRRQRWWYISMHNPTSTADEILHAKKIIERYHAEETAVLRVDRLVDSRVYLIEPECR